MKLVKVKKANVVMTIKDCDINRYLGKGYNLIDETGKIVKEGNSNNPENLKRKIKELIIENEKLKKALDEALSSKKEVELPKEEVLEEEASVENASKKKTKKKKVDIEETIVE